MDNILYVIVDTDGAPFDGKSFKTYSKALKELTKIEKETEEDYFIRQIN